MTGQFGGAPYRFPLEGRPGAAVETTAFHRAQGVVDAAGGQHVTEGHPAVAVLVQQAAGNGRGQTVLRFLRGYTGDLGDQRRCPLRLQNGERGQHGGSRRPESGGPLEYGVANARRHVELRDVAPQPGAVLMDQVCAIVEQTDGFLDRERQPVGVIAEEVREFR